MDGIQNWESSGLLVGRNIKYTKTTKFCEGFRETLLFTANMMGRLLKRQMKWKVQRTRNWKLVSTNVWNAKAQVSAIF